MNYVRSLYFLFGLRKICTFHLVCIAYSKICTISLVCIEYFTIYLVCIRSLL